MPSTSNNAMDAKNANNAMDDTGEGADIHYGEEGTRPREIDMRPTRPELVSGFFLTLTLFLGVIVSGLFLLWTLHRWATQEELNHSRPTRTEFVDGLKEQNEGEFETPSPSEYRALQEPSLNATLATISEAVRETATILDEVPRMASRPGSTFHGSRPHAIDSVDIVPRFIRWQFNFSATDIQDHAAQLDHFGIELGVVGGGIQGVDLVSGLSSDLNVRRVADPTDERRLYFMWKWDGPLKEMEERLLARAGVATADRQTVRFLPHDLENELARKELEYAETAGHGSVTEIARTVFQCAPSEDDYVLEIVEQRYRTKK